MGVSNFIINASSFFFTYFFIKKFLPFFKNNLADQPNARSSHLISTPRGIGIVFSLLSSLFCVLQGFNIILSILPLSFVGFADDLINLKAKYKYYVQLIVGIIVTLSSPLKEYLINDVYTLFGMLSILILIIGFTAIINFINFMDGIDGLISGCFIFIILGSIHVLEIPLWPVLFSITAFLFFNWSPAKAFMGDSGSLFLGGLYALVLFESKDAKEFLGLLLLSSPLLIDSIVCIFRRFFNKENIFTAHKKHLYQRLNQAGWSHSSVSLLYISLVILQFICLRLFDLRLEIMSTLFILFMGVYLERFCAKRFNNSPESIK
tara:strand:- start:4436 stop:5395 length:960 start_codon:yes stop_codon:yes gene_type:complete